MSISHAGVKFCKALMQTFLWLLWSSLQQLECVHSRKSRAWSGLWSGGFRLPVAQAHDLLAFEVGELLKRIAEVRFGSGGRVNRCYRVSRKVRNNEDWSELRLLLKGDGFIDFSRIEEGLESRVFKVDVLLFL